MAVEGAPPVVTHPFGGERADVRHGADPHLADDLGGKAAGLLTMARLGLPVPAGFTLPIAAGRRYLSEGWSEELDRAARLGVVDLEARTGRRLGDAQRPLLVSVRSGAAVSMPGMMDTLVNVGITDDVVRGLASMTGDEEFAADTRRRAMAGHAALGSTPAEDPLEQVLAAIRSVFESWNSDRARAFREAVGIDHGGATSATVQMMVFGNLGGDSGTGVAFTRDPRSGALGLMGDFLVGAQGDDVVSGTCSGRPLAEMAELWPAVWGQLESAGRRLEHHLNDMVDIEFTVERGTLHLLQFRRAARSAHAAFRAAVDMADDPEFPLDRAEAVRRCGPLMAEPPAQDHADGNDVAAPLAVGIAASPGVASGVVCVELDDALERSERGEFVILFRPETSPADVAAMAVAAGLVTAVGGLMSHAAVVAREWDLPAVVGVAGLEVGIGGVVVGGRRVAVGDRVTIDGTAGRVLLGSPSSSSTPIPEVAVIEEWAASMARE